MRSAAGKDEWRTIQVSEEVYQRLAGLAQPFETEDDLLERLLLDLVPQTRVDGAPQNGGVDLVSHVGRIPHGTRLKGRYKGREYEAKVENGRVIWNGKSFESLSYAAVAVIQSTGSSRPTENGWRFWEAQDPKTGEWVFTGQLFRRDSE